MVSHRFLLLALALLYLVDAGPAHPKTKHKGKKEKLDEICDSMPKGDDGETLKGVELFKKMNKDNFAKAGKDIEEIDKIADFKAKMKLKKGKEFKAKQQALYKKNKDKIDLAIAENNKLNAKPIPDTDAQPTYDQINSALGMDAILVESDIEMDLDTMKALYGEEEETSGSRYKRQAFYDSNYPSTIWSDGVYYYFDDALNSEARTAIQQAIDFYEQNTCIRFHEVTDAASSPSTPVIKIYPGAGCHSAIGKNFWATEQTLSLGAGCESFDIAAHELAHALGIFHEQSRYDRDSFVYVNEDNIETGGGDQYNLENTDTNYNYGLKYEFRGIMHYRPKQLGKNDEEATVMFALDPLYQQAIGGSKRPVFTDIYELNRHYSCDQCANSGTSCYYGGIPNPNSCGTCICPSGFGGADCGDREAPKAGATCGADLSATSTWKTLNVTNKVGNGQWAVGDLDNPPQCTWHIYGPSGSKVQWKVISVGQDNDNNGLCYDMCYFGGVNIKGHESSWKNEGIRYCCPAQYNTITASNSNLATITAWNNYLYTDFVIQYKTV